jgi:hypothetical protein
VAREWTEEEWGAVLEQLRTDGTIHAKEVLFDTDSIRRLLDAASHVIGKPHFASADFDGATFGDETSFDGASFGDGATFRKATFGDRASFNGVTFRDRATFDEAIFGDIAGFYGAAFGDRASFNGVTFGNGARFGETTFGDKVDFYGAAFGNRASFNEASFGQEVGFDGATFGHGAGFYGAAFGNRASFNAVTFGNGARFGETTFGDRATFDGATFGHEASFDWVTFGGGADFYGATFGDWAKFDGATFEDGATFGGATFGDRANFDRAGFKNRARFGEVTFGDWATFGRATFGDGATFRRATFGDQARFYKSIFGKSTVFASVLVMGDLVLNAEFGEASLLDLTAQSVEKSRLILPAGGTIRVRWAKVYLEESAFPQPTILALLPETSCCPAEAIALALSPRTASHPAALPSVMSLRWANLAGLVIGENVSLAACLFEGAHNLDKVRFEGRTEFAHAPTIFGGKGRQALAEEHHWRTMVRKERGWFAAPEWSTGDPKPLRPATIASLYRGLRKGREDSKDEPGAADFYYGEMEMRRFAAGWGAERLLLTAYWLSCGYGLRAWRAFAWLVALLVVGAVLFTSVGFDRSPMRASQPDRVMPSGQLHYATVTPPHTAAVDGLKFAVDTSTSLLHTPSDRPLTWAGSVTELALRFAGPLLLGLALLSLRGRVRR